MLLKVLLALILLISMVSLIESDTKPDPICGKNCEVLKESVDLDKSPEDGDVDACVASCEANHVTLPPHLNITHLHLCSSLLAYDTCLKLKGCSNNVPETNVSECQKLQCGESCDGFQDIKSNIAIKNVTKDVCDQYKKALDCLEKDVYCEDHPDKATLKNVLETNKKVCEVPNSNTNPQNTTNSSTLLDAMAPDNGLLFLLLAKIWIILFTELL